MHKKKGLKLEDGDIVVITEKIVSKAQGRVIHLNDIVPSQKALELSKITGKDPRIIELILRESSEILILSKNFLLVKTKHGFVCANAGIDESNVEEGKVKLLPENPDDVARAIRKELERLSGKRVAVLIIDSIGRPFRIGSVGTSIGSSGIISIYDRRGHRDIYGRTLKSTIVCVADNIAGIANLVFGEADEKIPVCIIRGLKSFLGNGSVKDIIRREERDLCLRAIKELKRIKNVDFLVY